MTLEALAVMQTALKAWSESGAAGFGEKDGDPGRSELEDGAGVSAETFRRLFCDPGLVGVLRGVGRLMTISDLPICFAPGT